MNFLRPHVEHLADWKTSSPPHYDTALRMLGVTPNPKLWPANHFMCEVATELGQQATFQTHSRVGIFFGDPDKEGRRWAIRFLAGRGQSGTGVFTAGRMVGCRHNAKNTLVKNYLYLAEKRGTNAHGNGSTRHRAPAQFSTGRGTVRGPRAEFDRGDRARGNGNPGTECDRVGECDWDDAVVVPV